MVGLREVSLWRVGSEGGWRVRGGKRRGAGVGEHDLTKCERPDTHTVNSEVDGRQWTEAACGRETVWRILTCNSSQDDATVKCWGDNSDGQLGYGDKLDRGDGSNGGCPARPACSSLLLYSRYRS